MRYTPEDIITMREEAAAAGLDAPLLFWNADVERLCRVCNGVGAEDSPEWVRDLLTWLYRHYATAAAIHDCRYELSDGTADNRGDADSEFLTNCLKLWRRRFGWTRFFRPAARLDKKKIDAAYEVLVEFGGDAWLEAYKRNEADYGD